MAHSRRQTGSSPRSAPRVARESIALALDGALPVTDLEATAAYRAAVVPLSTHLNRQLDRLRLLGEAGLVAATTRFDDTHRLLEALGVPAISTCAISEVRSWPGVVLVGCHSAHDAAQNAWLERILVRGAIVVSSDRSAVLPAISNRLNVDRNQPGRRARVALLPAVAGLTELDSAWGRLLAEMHPAVRLAPGYRPLSREQLRTTTILASDALTDEPLVVLAPVRNGQVLHSAPHWWQDQTPDTTEIGRRPLTEIPAFAALGIEYRDAVLGGFGAASVMLACLLAGLDAALDRVGGQARGNRSAQRFDAA